MCEEKGEFLSSTLIIQVEKELVGPCHSLSVSVCSSPSCASVGIWELLLLELLLLLLLLWEVMEGLDCNFLVCFGPADEEEEVDEPPLGREPSFGCA